MHECHNEERLRKLEQSEAVMGVKIDNLVSEMKTLVSTLKNFIWVMIPTCLLGVGFLVAYWVKK